MIALLFFVMPTLLAAGLVMVTRMVSLSPEAISMRAFVSGLLIALYATMLIRLCWWSFS